MLPIEEDTEHLVQCTAHILCTLCSAHKSIVWSSYSVLQGHSLIKLLYIQTLLYKYTKQNVAYTETKLLPLSSLWRKVGGIAAVIP